MSLSGITRQGSSELRNPGSHSPVPMQNRVRVEVWGPKNKKKPELVCKAVREHVGNIMATFGLNRLCEIVATSVAYDSNTLNWVSAMRIGTHTQAEASGDDTLGASTASINITEASMQASDQGNRTLRYLGTFASNNPAGAAVINEVGLFCNSTAHSGMAARSTLGTDSVNKGASDEIRVSYDIVFTTA